MEAIKLGQTVFKPYLQNRRDPAVHQTTVIWIGRKLFKTQLYKDCQISIETLRHIDKRDPEFSFRVFLNKEEAMKFAESLKK